MEGQEACREERTARGGRACVQDMSIREGGRTVGTRSVQPGTIPFHTCGHSDYRAESFMKAGSFI